MPLTQEQLSRLDATLQLNLSKEEERRKRAALAQRRAKGTAAGWVELIDRLRTLASEINAKTGRGSPTLALSVQHHGDTQNASIHITENGQDVGAYLGLHRADGDLVNVAADFGNKNETWAGFDQFDVDDEYLGNLLLGYLEFYVDKKR